MLQALENTFRELASSELDDSAATRAHIQRVNAEPEVDVEDGAQQGSNVLEDSEDEENHTNSVDDEITEHLRWVSLQLIRNVDQFHGYECATQKKISSRFDDLRTYALGTEQKLVWEVEVNDKEENGQDGSNERTTTSNMEGEEVLDEVSAVKESAENDANDGEGGNDHSPPTHDDAAELKLQAEQKLF